MCSRVNKWQKCPLKSLIRRKNSLKLFLGYRLHRLNCLRSYVEWSAVITYLGALEYKYYKNVDCCVFVSTINLLFKNYKHFEIITQSKPNILLKSWVLKQILLHIFFNKNHRILKCSKTSVTSVVFCCFYKSQKSPLLVLVPGHCI